MARWKKVTPDIAEVGTLLLYNRAGIGKNSKATTKQSGDVVIVTLREVLKSLQLEPPYILVGWSIGGLFASYWRECIPVKPRLWSL
jgi:pimeloyl-ACP methyl ester carboxylesterase